MGTTQHNTTQHNTTQQNKNMSEFGLELPQPTKLGTNGKGEKAFIIGQSKVGVVAICTVVLLLLCGCLFLDVRAQRGELMSEHGIEEHQRLSKIEAETKMSEMSAEMHAQAEKAADEESDLKIMASHLQYTQEVSRMNIMKSIDDESLTVADIKKQVDEQFHSMQKETETILHDHLVVVEGANVKSNAEMDRIEEEVKQMTIAQQQYDAEMKAKQGNTNSQASTIQEAENEEIVSRIGSVFNHVSGIAQKMGDADIDDLLDTNSVKEWEQILTDTETGKLAYPDAVAKMEEIITKAPAALKLAQVTGALELIEADGGAKGVTEITNFRNLLKQVHWLPQYAAVLEEFSLWSQNKRTTQEIIAWTEDKMNKGELDGTWLAKAYETAAEEQQKPATATTASASAATTATRAHSKISHAAASSAATATTGHGL